MLFALTRGGKIKKRGKRGEACAWPTFEKKSGKKRGENWAQVHCSGKGGKGIKKNARCAYTLFSGGEGGGEKKKGKKRGGDDR